MWLYCWHLYLYQQIPSWTTQIVPYCPVRTSAVSHSPTIRAQAPPPRVTYSSSAQSNCQFMACSWLCGYMQSIHNPAFLPEPQLKSSPHFCRQMQKNGWCCLTKRPIEDYTTKLRFICPLCSFSPCFKAQTCMLSKHMLRKVPIYRIHPGRVEPTFSSSDCPSRAIAVTSRNDISM